jgi:hypothetical protein
VLTVDGGRMDYIGHESIIAAITMLAAHPAAARIKFRGALTNVNSSRVFILLGVTP